VRLLVFASVSFRRAMLLLTCFLSIACFEYCFFALRRLQWVYALWYHVCLTNVCGASTRNFTVFSASWLQVYSSTVCFCLAMLYRNKQTYLLSKLQCTKIKPAVTLQLIYKWFVSWRHVVHIIGTIKQRRSTKNDWPYRIAE